MKEFNNYFLWEPCGKRNDGGKKKLSQWELLFLPWESDSFTTLWKGRKETMWHNSGWAEELKKGGKKDMPLGGG